MDAYEATKIVFQRIQACDPENASKIMGILLIQDHGEKEMIRLALGPEALVHSVIHKARKELALASSNPPSTPSTPSSPSPFSNPLSLSRQNSSSSVSSRLLGGVNVNLPSPLSIPNQSSAAASPWSNSSFSDFQTSDDLITASAYSGSSPSTMNSAAAAASFHANGGEVDLIDELQLQAQLSFLNDIPPSLGPKNPDFFYHQQQDLASSPSGDDAVMFPSYGGVPASVNGLPHRRSFSVSDICMGTDDLSAGYGWRPCLYYARGYCKNGTSCRFLHGEGGGSLLDAEGGAMVGSPSKFEIMEQCQELLRSKSIQHQRMVTASQLMASNNYSYSTFPSSKCMNFLMQQQFAPDSPRTQMLNDGMHKFSRSRFERSEFSLFGGSGGMASPGSRQIYLTFPADSTFREEDVSNYFSIFGPVQDVRIPYQQKRMFGFVTFEFSETVKLILAKGNPHFVCDARVLVKPYKEKGKIPDKYSFCRKQQQHMDKGEFTASGSPTGLESRDPFDLDLGARVFYNSQEMLLRRKLGKQADLQQAIELQNRRLMSLQLLDAEKNGHIRSPSTGTSVPSPTYSTSLFNQNAVLHDDHLESQEDNVDGRDNCLSLKFENSKESSPDKTDSQECLEHNLPDSPFASPKTVNDYDSTTFSDITIDSKNGGLISAPPSANSKNSVSGSSIFPANSSLDMGPFKSCYFHLPRFASGHETIGM